MRTTSANESLLSRVVFKQSINRTHIPLFSGVQNVLGFSRLLGNSHSRIRSPHALRSHSATARGSKRTQVPIRNEGILPAWACLKIVFLLTLRTWDSSSAVNA